MLDFPMKEQQMAYRDVYNTECLYFHTYPSLILAPILFPYIS